MAEDIKDLQTTNPSHPQIRTQDAAIDEVEEAMRRLRICPVRGFTLFTRISFRNAAEG